MEPLQVCAVEGRQPLLYAVDGESYVQDADREAGEDKPSRPGEVGPFRHGRKSLADAGRQLALLQTAPQWPVGRAWRP